MSQITPARNIIQNEETQYRAAVSEATLSRIGSTSNFISLYQHDKRDFYLNGFYGGVFTPYLGVDGLVVFEFPVELINVYIFSEISGTSGITELDVKWKPFTSGSYQSIFSTSPQALPAAASFDACGIGDVKAGFVAPVLSKVNFDAKDILRLDLITAMQGGARGTGIIIHYRPR